MSDDELSHTVGLRELSMRISALEAEQSIRKTIAKYSETLDYGDDAGWGACYTADGVFEVRRRGVPMFRHEGTPALVSFAASHTSAPAVYHKHLVGLPVIELDDGGVSASARTYFTMLHEGPEGPYVLVFGRYLDRLAREEDGVWRLSERVVDIEDNGTRVVPESLPGR
jgi:SnoaL-like domain